VSGEHGNGAAPPSAAERMYGPDGPISGGPSDSRTRELIESGIAKPAVSLFGDQRTPARPSPHANEPAFDPAKLPGYEGVDPAITQDLGRIGISERQATELRPIYERAVKDDMQRYASSLEQNVGRLQRELPAEDLRTVSELINDPQMTPPEMAEWLRTWGNHEGIATMLTRWARAIRNGRY
jgi:hypothetical protein